MAGEKKQVSKSIIRLEASLERQQHPTDVVQIQQTLVELNRIELAKLSKVNIGSS